MKKIIRIQFILFLSLLITSAGFAQLVTWNVSTMTGGAGNFGPSPLAPTTTNANVTVTGLTRGSGVGSTTGSGAARGWGGNTWAATSAAGITGNQFITFEVSANSGYTMSLSSLNPLDYRRSGTGATNGLVQYKINSGSYVDITTLNFTVSASSGASAGPVDLSAITALQNVASGDVVTFRLIPYGATSTSGTFYIFDFANSTASDLTINGTTTVASSCTVPGTPVCSIPAPVCEGSSVTIVGAGSLPAATTYTYWTAASGGTQITAGVTGNDLTTSNALTAGTYLFYVQGEDGTCVSAARQMVNVEILAAPTATLSGGGTTCSNLPTADMLVNFAGSGPWTFTYTDGTTPVTVTATNSNPYSISAAPVGNYSLVSVSNAGCAGAVSGTASIAINTPPSIVASTSQTPICEGASVNLSATGGINYSWQPGALIGAPTVSPTTTTVYTVTGSDAINSCTSTSTIEVVVNPLPDMSYAGDVTHTICNGDNVTYEILPTPVPYNVTWYDAQSGGNIYGVGAYGTYQFTVYGYYDFYFEFTDPITGCVNPNRGYAGQTAVRPLPTGIVTGGGISCNGNPAPNVYISFYNQGPNIGYYDFTYTDGTNVFSNSTTTGLFTISNPGPGTYSLIGSIYNGECYGPVAGSGSATVTIGTSPTITGIASPATVCDGQSTTLYGNGGVTYVWTDGTTNPADGVAFVPPTTSTYTVTGTGSNGCTSTASVAITVIPSPTITAISATPPSICLNGNSDLNAVSVGNSINWYDLPIGGTLLSSVASGVNFNVTPAFTSTYYAEALSPASGNQTFSYTGAPQTFVVPGGVTTLDIECWGAQGGANWVNNTNFGGYAKGTISVTPGETLTIYVGNQPTTLTGGFNGGGNGDGAGRAGGGASDVRQGGSALSNRVIIAGGGGGAGYWNSLEVIGGQGGGANLNGGDGYRVPNYATNPGGQGGTQIGSGTGTCINLNVAAMAGGLGYGGTPASFGCGCEGYGGGGGLYGGAGSGNCRGAGGGSGYIDASATNVVATSGIRAGDGEVKLSWSGSACASQKVPITVTVNAPSASNLVMPSSTVLCQTMLQNAGTNTYGNPNCELIASITGAGLGSTDVCAIFGTNQTWNTEPYADRVYSIVPTNNGLPANICLYYTASDLASASITNNSEISITKVGGNGVLGGPGAVEEILNSSMTITDIGTVKEVCFPVTSLSSFYLHSTNPNNIPLAVNLKSFTGEIKSNHDVLSWISSAEINHAGYLLQHSTDGIHFKELGYITSKSTNGNSQVTLSYEFTNANPIVGHNYYRLEMLDLDGKTTRHNQVIDLVHTADGQVVTLYPNPVVDQLEINLTLTKSQMNTIKLMDMSGRLIKEIQVQGTQGYNHVSMDMKGIAAGMYTVQVYQNNQVMFVGKVRKQDQ